MNAILILTYINDDRYNHNSCYRRVSTIIQDNTIVTLYVMLYYLDKLFYLYNDACLIVAIPFSLQECIFEKTN